MAEPRFPQMFCADVGSDPTLAAGADEVARVVGLVGREREPVSLSALPLLLFPFQLLDAFAPCAFAVCHRDRGLTLGLPVGLGDLEVHDETVAVLHQRVAHIGELRLASGTFPPKPRLWSRLRLMRVVAAF